MTRIYHPEIDSQLQEFYAEPKLPLEVNKYEDGERQEWSVYYPQNSSWSPCIAAFTTWWEAYEFAYTQALAAYTLMGVLPKSELKFDGVAAFADRVYRVSSKPTERNHDVSL